MSFLETALGPAPVRYHLANGLTVLLQPSTLARLVTVQVWVKTGSIHEGVHLGSGLSHYLEHMIFKGTARRPGTALSRCVQEAGGSINAYTTFDRTVYHVDLPSESAELGLDLLADAVFNPLLPSDEAVKEKDVILREIAMTQDEPDQIVAEAVFATAYREHPYRQPVIGHREPFQNIPVEALREYHSARYVPNNCVLIIAGDVDPDELKPLIEKHFGSLVRRALSPVHVPDEPAQLDRRVVRLTGDVNICRGVLAYKIPHLAHPDSPALDLLSGLLGAGGSSLLWQSIREEQNLVHTIDVSCWAPGQSGLLWVGFTCDHGKAGEVAEAVQKEFDKLIHEGVKPAQLDKIRRQVLVAFLNSRKTIGGQAGRLGAGEVILGDIGYSRRYLERLQAVTPEQVVTAAGTYLVSHTVTDLIHDKPAAATAAVATARAAGPSSDFAEIKLSNGARLLWQRDNTLPKIHFRTAHLASALAEPADKRGLSSLWIGMLRSDTAKRTDAEVSEATDAVGAHFDDTCGNNSAGLSLEVLSGDLPLALDLLDQSLLHPKFAARSFRNERNSAVADVRDDEDDVVEHARRRLRELWFGDHPFGVPYPGRIADLEALTAKDLKDFHHRVMTGPNTIMAVSGDLDPEKDLPAIAALLEKLPATPFMPEVRTHTGPASPGRHVRSLPREQAVVLSAWNDVGVDHDDWVCGDILSELANEMSGRLFLRVREELALAYFVGAGRLAGLGHGLFTLSAGCAPGKEEDVWREFTAEMDRWCGPGITEEELARSKLRLSVGRRGQMQTASSRALQAALNGLYQLPINSWRTYDDRLNAVTLDRLKEFCRKNFQSTARLDLVVRPEAK